MGTSIQEDIFKEYFKKLDHEEGFPNTIILGLKDLNKKGKINQKNIIQLIENADKSDKSDKSKKD